MEIENSGDLAKRDARKKYSKSDLENAISDVNNKLLNVAAAGRKFNIPEQTLRDRLSGKHSEHRKNLQVLDETQEKKLVEFIILQAKCGNPLTKLQIIKLAGEIASLNDPESRKFKKYSPSPSWINGFMKRHPDISKRTPSSLGKSSAVHNVDDLKNFFVEIYKYFEKENLLYLLDRPGQWWNADESGFELNHKPTKCYAKKGQKSVYSVQRGKPKEMITTSYAISGDGQCLEPLVIFKASFSNMIGVAHTLGCKISRSICFNCYSY